MTSWWRNTLTTLLPMSLCSRGSGVDVGANGN